MPDINSRLDVFVRRFEKLMDNISRELLNADITQLNNAQQKKLLKRINKMISDIEKYAEDQTPHIVEDMYQDGRIATVVALGLAGTGAGLITNANGISDGAREIAMNFLKENPLQERLHNATKQQIADSFYDDLLMATQNTRRAVKKAVRKAYAQYLTKAMQKGTGVKQARRDVAQEIKKEIDRLKIQMIEESDFAIRDKAGRKWSVEGYTKVVTHTKMLQANRKGTELEAVSRGAFYAVISDHNSKHRDCAKWENKIVKLTNNAEGDYPTLTEVIAKNQVFHPYCKHTFFPVRDLNNLPEKILNKN